MAWLLLVGRVLLALLFLGSGGGHLTQTQMMTGYAQSNDDNGAIRIPDVVTRWPRRPDWARLPSTPR